ncbi:SAG family member [Eimeria brunetti]|uniref:SAG family member n=1 Tax=Eimeria brunetti TaxID=51314 RepID=U6LCZ8_9EIME|nr:SAG family member [Eimeria brunetti]
MASFCKTAAAVCLIALYGLRSGASEPTITYKYEAVNVDDAGYLAVKLVRNGKLPVRIGEVEKDSSLVTALTQKVETKTVEKQGSGASEDPCGTLMEANKLKDIFHYTFEYEQTPSQDIPNYRKLLQAALDAGLTVFKTNGYQDKWDKIWASDAGASLAHLLGSNSTKIGCVIGKCIQVVTQNESRVEGPTESPTGKGALFCELNPAAQKNQAPFEEEYFNGLIARTTQLTDMTEDDLKAPANGATVAAAVPTILAAGFDCCCEQQTQGRVEATLSNIIRDQLLCSPATPPHIEKDIFHYTFDYEEKLNYRELLQKALDTGLEVFKNHQGENKWETIWQGDAGANLAYLLGANSTTIGCVTGQCTTKKSGGDDERSLPDGATGKAMLFCELKPAAQKNQAAFE